MCGTDVAGYVSEGPGLSVYALSDGTVYRTYVSTARGVIAHPGGRAPVSPAISAAISFACFRSAGLRISATVGNDRLFAGWAQARGGSALPRTAQVDECSL